LTARATLQLAVAAAGHRGRLHRAVAPEAAPEHNARGHHHLRGVPGVPGVQQHGQFLAGGVGQRAPHAGEPREHGPAHHQ
jgi:hypothetical protein